MDSLQSVDHRDRAEDFSQPPVRSRAFQETNPGSDPGCTFSPKPPTYAQAAAAAAMPGAWTGDGVRGRGVATLLASAKANRRAYKKFWQFSGNRTEIRVRPAAFDCGSMRPSA